MAVQKVFFESSKLVKWLNPTLAFNAQLGSQMGFYPIDEETGAKLEFKTELPEPPTQKKSAVVAEGEISDYPIGTQIEVINDEVTQPKKRGRKPKSTN